MTNTLSQSVQHAIQILFAGDEQAEAACLLEEQCNEWLPNISLHDVERVRLAVLKLSGGNLTRLKAAVNETKADWRDTLISAGFGFNIHAHLQWIPVSPQRQL